jgi:MATE family multidrug resistance protein
MGWFIGLGRSKRALTMQIALNLMNVSLSLLFVIKFKMGLHGVGLATALAEWGGLACGLLLALGEIRRRGGLIPEAIKKSSLLKLSELAKLGQANTNIFIRTAALTFGFSFFGNAAASQGETFLAANHIHLQLITLSAFILDGFANTAEAVVGAAYGAKSRTRFDRAVRLTSEFSFGFALICGALIYGFGGVIIDQLTNDSAVQSMARIYLPYCAMAPVLGFAAFQLDGVFIGTTRTKEMRNAGIAAVLIYLGIFYIWTLTSGQGSQNGHMIWISFLIYYLARTVTLLYYYPKIRPAE